MPMITNIDDLKKIYRRRVPKMFFDYAESGSWTEQTFRANVSDFADLLLRQRVAVDMSGRHTRNPLRGRATSCGVSVSVRLPQHECCGKTLGTPLPLRHPNPLLEAAFVRLLGATSTWLRIRRSA